MGDAIHICPTCKGKKLLLGMGGIMKECGLCKGIGHVKNNMVDQQNTNTEVIKKRGRPVKLKEVSNDQEMGTDS